MERKGDIGKGKEITGREKRKWEGKEGKGKGREETGGERR